MEVKLDLHQGGRKTNMANTDQKKTSRRLTGGEKYQLQTHIKKHREALDGLTKRKMAQICQEALDFEIEITPGHIEGAIKALEEAKQPIPNFSADRPRAHALKVHGVRIDDLERANTDLRDEIARLWEAIDILRELNKVQHGSPVRPVAG